MRCLPLLCLSLLLLSAPVPAAEPLPLAVDGGSDYVIGVPAEPDAVVETAARELQEHLAQATGATLRIVPEGWTT